MQKLYKRMAGKKIPARTLSFGIDYHGVIRIRTFNQPVLNRLELFYPLRPPNPQDHALAGISLHKNAILYRKMETGEGGSVGEKYADAGFGSVAIIENYVRDFRQAHGSCGPEIHRHTPHCLAQIQLTGWSSRDGIVLNQARPRDRQPLVL
jgi:hypothetical protein